MVSRCVKAVNCQTIKVMIRQAVVKATIHGKDFLVCGLIITNAIKSM